MPNPTIDSTHSESRSARYTNDRGARQCRWSPANTIAMVLGFVFFWPVGLIVLFWVLSGHHVRDLPQAAREIWEKLSASWPGTRDNGSSDNVVFNDYQSTQYERIREIRDEITERARRFKAFRGDAQRRRDQEEFDRFMASAPDQPAR